MVIKSVSLMNDNKLPIMEFKLEQMVEHPSIIMIAKRGSGKSWIVKAILKKFKNIPMGLIIAPTDRNNAFYSDFFPDTYIHYSYKPEIIERLLIRQQSMIEKAKQYIKKGKKIDTRSFIIMDDCLASKGSWAKDPNISELLMNGRHSHIMYILTMQFPLGISPELRCNFDYIFLLTANSMTDMKRMYEHYAGMFRTLKEFQQVFTLLTKDHGSLVISNRGANDTLLDKIFHYKAPDLRSEKFTIGCHQFNKFHSKNYNSDWRKAQQHFDIDKYLDSKKISKSRIEIAKIE